MVHQKNLDTNFDFDKQGIDMFVDGDWVKAKGTTLGADNGIGVVAIMTLLVTDESTDELCVEIPVFLLEPLKKIFKKIKG